MRFYPVAVGAMIMLLSRINAITPEDMNNRNTQATAKIIGVIEPRGAVKRSLRLQVEKQASLYSLNDSDERAGVSPNDLLNIVKSKKGVIEVELEKMNESFQKKVLGIFREQHLSQKKLAAKLGLNSIDDTKARNYAWFEKNMKEFRKAKKPKKVPEDRIEDWS